MLSSRALTLFASALCTSFTQISAAPAPQGSTAPATTPSSTPSSGSSSYWFASIDHSQDTVWMGSSGYKVFRDVVADYGADNTGSSDASAAINQAMADGGRCGGGITCDSSTITPAILYFQPGTYLINNATTMYYYTQMVGDATDPPTLKASSTFSGMAVIDADPYDYLANGSAANWYTNQNNFFRQVRNFVIDITESGGGLTGAGIHWQVAQATSLQNIVFKMSEDPATTQQGIFMDNGSGGWMSDLTFYGGHQGAFLGSQQFTTRNMTFWNCQTAIFMNWNWGWTLQGITVNGGGTALDMSNQPTNQTVGSVVLADSKFSDVEYGVRFAYQNTSANVYPTGGTLIIDNVDMTGVTTAAVVDNNNNTVVPKGMINSWASGNGYTATQGSSTNVLSPTRQENPIIAPNKAPSLLVNSTGNLFTQSRPQYESLSTNSFVSAMSSGCKGDGQTDDTDAINSLLQKVASSGQVAYFEHGAYLVQDTITVPPGVKMTGEIWPLIMADGAYFNDSSNPKPVFQIGKPGQSGGFEISDFIFQTLGPAPGAIMVEWNLDCPQGACGFWDTHVRIGGSAGTQLTSPECAAIQDGSTGYQIDQSCDGVFLMFHATKQSSGVYVENSWFWVADHNLDQDAPDRVTIYSGRGMLVQSQGPVWLWGTASEHSILYNYQFDGVQALYSGLMQSETPYMQPYPEAPTPFQFNEQYDDPMFTICSNASTANSPPCKDAWGMRIYNSKNVLIYSTGLYSFFQNYNQDCVNTKNCQQNMIHIQNSQVDMYAVNTANTVNILVDDNAGTVTAADNRNWFCDTVSYYFTGH